MHGPALLIVFSIERALEPIAQPTFQISIHRSTIADLYSAIGLLIKESDSKTARLIKESKERKLSFCRAEFTKIRVEIKVGDTPAKKSTEEKLGTSKQKYDKVYEDDRDGLTMLCDQVEKNHVDLHVETFGMEKSDAQADVAANSTMEESDAQADAAANSNMKESDAQVDTTVKADGVLPENMLRLKLKPIQTWKILMLMLMLMLMLQRRVMVFF
ncbi:hypothetical protein Dsin_021751 [Dipteronia sinensis]|uniref:Uncharacterized protein n=1 Tax=Dipteronia sinensis TaxID=43782 RepID=A0AAE0A1Q4_9ROSI|nr:hypothetical protein Dsin_021751 [Dipteronia sinensis]